MEKRGQVSLFIIIGIIIVLGVSFFFLSRAGIIPELSGGKEVNPNSFLTTCLEDEIKTTINTISSQGGYMKSILYKTYDDKNISYLCYNQNYYDACINQEPLLIPHLEEEIKTEISEDVQTCFDTMTFNLKDKEGYTVAPEYRGFEVELVPSKVILNLNAKLTLTKSDQTTKQDNFTIIIPSKIYDLAVVSQEIVKQEAKFCNFENQGYMLLEPKTKILEKTVGNQSKIYIVQDKKTKEEFQFAIRSCALPAGV